MGKDYFEHIYTEYYNILKLFSLRIVGNPSAAEDIVQDVFAEIWTKRKEIDITKAIKPYLYKLTYNRSL
ncbi:MAG: sigma factor, partial [Bacteroidia bacterium]|nr:sigma factor [Bacteroidia bacterium]